MHSAITGKSGKKKKKKKRKKKKVKEPVVESVVQKQESLKLPNSPLMIKPNIFEERHKNLNKAWGEDNLEEQK